MAKIVRQGFKSKYKYVRGIITYDRVMFLVNIPSLSFSKTFDDERSAALGADIALIRGGKEPKNILKRRK